MNKILVVLLAITLMACEELISFDEPQPINKKDLNQMPRKLRGNYFSNSDSTFLTITKNQIIEWANFEAKTLKDSLIIDVDSTKIVEQSPSSLKLVNDNYKLNFTFYPNDSVLINYSYKDTIFNISDKHIFRRFKGHYFLNYKRSENNWKVKRLTINNCELTFSRVDKPEDISSLKEITTVEEIKSDSGKVIGHKIKPTRKELKQLMKHYFHETKMFKKIE